MVRLSKRNIIILTGGLAGMLVLIFDGRTAVEGIRQGIDICLQTLIPSLFPFFVLSGIVLSSLMGQPIPFLRILGRFCHMPEGSESLLAVGILGGYPVGAGAVWAAYKKGQISAGEANRLVIFCNNAGPSFLFGILGPMFPSGGYVWRLWLVQIVAAMLTGYLLGETGEISCKHVEQYPDFSDTLNRAIRNMAGVCGWVVLFRMVLEFLDRWILWLFDPSIQVLFSGILELSNGCLRLQNIAKPEIRFLLASAMLSIGGFCVLMQTHAVFPDLRMKQYLIGKLIHLLLSSVLSLMALFLLHEKMTSFLLCLTGMIAVTAILGKRLRKSKIAVAIP